MIPQVSTQVPTQVSPTAMSEVQNGRQQGPCHKVASCYMNEAIGVYPIVISPIVIVIVFRHWAYILVYAKLLHQQFISFIEDFT